MIDNLPEDVINLIFNNLEENNPCKYDMSKGILFKDGYKFYIIIKKYKSIFQKIY